MDSSITVISKKFRPTKAAPPLPQLYITAGGVNLLEMLCWVYAKCNGMHTLQFCSVFVIRRGQNGLLDLIEIIINKVKTVVQNGTIRVEKNSISLPYDHTYQHIFQYGIYTRLKSSLLPLTVTWHTVVGGLDSVWVELEQELSSDLSGLCSIQNSGMIFSDFWFLWSHLQLCRQFFSQTIDCMTFQTPKYISLCDENAYSYEGSSDIMCAFFKEIALICKC
uniref:Uncharacterized protein n=1 Tax=Fundulus heteroclitus TaxID=8078 RepID=A0A3Q2SRS0_FUNHE